METTFAAMAYRSLLRLLPSDFRAQFGAEMEILFAARLAAARGPGRLKVWGSGAWDVIRHAAIVRLRPSVRGPAGAARSQGPGGWRHGRDGFVRDVQLGVRVLARAPGFTAVACLTLALGVGATTAVFAVVHALLLRPLPYADPDELVLLWPEQGWNIGMLGRIPDALPSLEGVTGISQWTLTLYDDSRDPEQVTALFVSWNHFDVLGVRPLLGRTFRPEEGERGGGAVTLLSYEFWQSRYGGDPDILGRVIRLSDGTHPARTVIGILPPRYEAIVGEPIAWVPIEATPPGVALSQDYTWWINWRVGRLREGATRDRVEAELARIAPSIRAEAPDLIDAETARSPTAPPLRETLTGSLRPTLGVLSGAVLLVLLISCVNVANLLLARGEARRGEVALRRALGAGRTRILRQLLTESLVLSVAGSILGVVLGRLLLAIMVARAPSSLPDLASVSMNGAVLAFALATAVLSALLFGSLPALRAGRSSEAELIRQGRGSLGRRGAERVTSSLVVVEIALAVVLVVASALMVRTLGQLYRVDPGFRADGVLTLRVDPSDTRVPDQAAAGRFFEELIGEVRSLSGVAAAAGVQILPVTDNNWSFPLFVEGHVLAPGASPPMHSFRVVSGDYFGTLEIPVLRGRGIGEQDHSTAMRVAVVNRAFADRYWPGQDPIGRQIRAFSANAAAMTVVGVVGDVHQLALHLPAQPELYVPYVQIGWPVGALSLVVRAADGDPIRLAPAVRAVVRSRDRDAVISNLEPMAEVVMRSAESTRFIATLLAAFGLLALLLGAVGVYGVTAFSLARRLPEFGVRLALGATRGAVMRAALGHGLVPVGIGIGLGALGSLAATRLLESLLFETSPTDAPTFIAVSLLLAVVGVAALLIPTRRATRMDPSAVLRLE